MKSCVALDAVAVFAFEQEEAEPDLVCMAKGLGAGYQPIGAVVANDRVYQAIADGSGFSNMVILLWRTLWRALLPWQPFKPSSKMIY